MNERIQELFKQPALHRNDHTTEQRLYEVEKFALLIVRECCRVVDIWSDEVPCSEGYDKFTVGKLKEHFGVKE